VLISRFAHPVLAKSPPSNGFSGPGRGRGGSGKVLDMGCGKGGDMTKWAKAHVRELFGVGAFSFGIGSEPHHDRAQILRRCRWIKRVHVGNQCVAHGSKLILLRWIVTPSLSPKRFPPQNSRNHSTSSRCNFACTTLLRLSKRRVACLRTSAGI
jgi:hypothetical protein